MRERLRNNGRSYETEQIDLKPCVVKNGRGLLHTYPSITRIVLHVSYNSGTVFVQYLPYAFAPLVYDGTGAGCPAKPGSLELNRLNNSRISRPDPLGSSCPLLEAKRRLAANIPGKLLYQLRNPAPKYQHAHTFSALRPSSLSAKYNSLGSLHVSPRPRSQLPEPARHSPSGACTPRWRDSTCFQELS